MTIENPLYTDSDKRRYVAFCKQLPKEKLLVIIEELLTELNMANNQLATLKGSYDVLRRMYSALDNGWLNEPETK